MNMMIFTAAAVALVTSAAIAQATPTTAVAPAATAGATPSAGIDLTVRFTGMETASGAILFVLFDSNAAFDGRGAPVRQEMVPVTGGSAQVVLRGLPAGRYAIKAFHDVDGNGQMATNPFGMPTEPFAFSNDAVGSMGPASWADANFAVSADNASHVITIR